LNKEGKNLKAIEATTPVKIETDTNNYTDTEPKTGHRGAVFSLAGMVGAVTIGSILIWFLQKDVLNQKLNNSQPKEPVEVVSKVPEFGSDKSDEKTVIQSDAVPKQEKVASVKLPKKVSVELAGQDKIESKIKVPTKTAHVSQQKKQVDVVPVAPKSDGDNSGGKQETQSKIEPKQEKSTSVKLPKEKQVLAKSAEQVEVASKVEVSTEKSSEKSLEAPVKPMQKANLLSEKKDLATDNLIKQHMASAEKSVVAFRLTTPSKNNAYFYYQSVLKIDPDHEGARKGMRQIVDRYILLMDNAMQKNQVDLAQVYLERAKDVLPNSPYLEKKSEELVEFMQSLQDDNDETESQNF